MKTKVLYLGLLLLSGCCSWCIPPEASSEISKNAARCDAYVTFMSAGQTSREQDQAFIRALRRAIHAQNAAMNNVPLPPDVEAWFARQSLGLMSSATEAPSASNAATQPTSLQPETPPQWQWIPR